MQDQPLGGRIPRCSKARAMFAMRACRKSVMVGMPLTAAQMRTVSIFFISGIVLVFFSSLSSFSSSLAIYFSPSFPAVVFFPPSGEKSVMT
jgi:hypothetical protein